jgi:uncharacterized iron-regulated membrane protein
MYDHQEILRATPKQDFTMSQWRSQSSNKNRTSSQRATKRGQPVMLHADMQLPVLEGCQANHVHDVNKTAVSDSTAAECLEELTAAALQLAAACYRVVTEMYSTVMAIAHLAVEAGKLTWTLGYSRWWLGNVCIAWARASGRRWLHDGSLGLCGECLIYGK